MVPSRAGPGCSCGLTTPGGGNVGRRGGELVLGFDFGFLRRIGLGFGSLNPNIIRSSSKPRLESLTRLWNTRFFSRYCLAASFFFSAGLFGWPPLFRLRSSSDSNPKDP